MPLETQKPPSHETTSTESQLRDLMREFNDLMQRILGVTSGLVVGQTLQAQLGSVQRTMRIAMQAGNHRSTMPHEAARRRNELFILWGKEKRFGFDTSSIIRGMTKELIPRLFALAQGIESCENPTLLARTMGHEALISSARTFDPGCDGDFQDFAERNIVAAMEQYMKEAAPALMRKYGQPFDATTLGSYAQNAVMRMCDVRQLARLEATHGESFCAWARREGSKGDNYEELMLSTAMRLMPWLMELVTETFCSPESRSFIEITQAGALCLCDRLRRFDPTKEMDFKRWASKEMLLCMQGVCERKNGDSWRNPACPAAHTSASVRPVPFTPAPAKIDGPRPASPPTLRPAPAPAPTKSVSVPPVEVGRAEPENQKEGADELDPAERKAEKVLQWARGEKNLFNPHEIAQMGSYDLLADLLAAKYTPMSQSIARVKIPKGITTLKRHHLEGVTLLALHRAVRDFDPDDGHVVQFLKDRMQTAVDTEIGRHARELLRR